MVRGGGCIGAACSVLRHSALHRCPAHLQSLFDTMGPKARPLSMMLWVRGSDKQCQHAITWLAAKKGRRVHSDS